MKALIKFNKLSVPIFAMAFWFFSESSHGEIGFVGDQEVEIKRVAQGRFIYPRAALRREIEGYVKIQLTVGETGEVIDAFVLEASPPNRFEKNALKFVRSLRYEPLQINGVPHRVEKVVVPVRYELQRLATR